MPVVNLTDACYEALEKLKEEVRNGKRARGELPKTTFSECVWMLLHKHESGRVHK